MKVDSMLAPKPGVPPALISLPNPPPAPTAVIVSSETPAGTV